MTTELSQIKNNSGDGEEFNPGRNSRDISFPSIFNDVIGPVMRGPSSSHCAAALRIGRMARDLMDGRIEDVLIEFDSEGSLAATHTTQGSDMGLLGGLLGWDATDERLAESQRAIQEAGIKVRMEVVNLEAGHPNTYKLTLKNSSEQHTLTAISIGGGMIEIVEIDNASVSMTGDYYEALLYFDSYHSEILKILKEGIEADEIIPLSGADARIVEIKTQSLLDKGMISELCSQYGIRFVKTILPVLPVLSRKKMQVPFITCKEMLEYNAGKDLELWELAVHYESARGNLSHEQVFQKMKEIVLIMQKSILDGIEGTKYADRILGYQSGQFRTQMENHRLLDGGMLNRIILYVTAMMEMKSSMGVIVAAPTAGSCGGLPGACIGAASAMGLSVDDMTQAMLAAGMIGVFIAAHATFAAEVGGCQAECGAGSGMAAAALVTLASGNVKQAVDAVSMSLQNILGMICDPVASRVEVPCLGKNVMAASNALACANMALAGYDAVISLDEVIDTMDKVGKSIPHELRCTALGGLSLTRTSREIEKSLNIT
ncbi:MAG: L-serine ammonia-lyase, iron-sulfur-dependent, subunit alpha [Anaerolineales bacterium]|nr:L-serine ammonia-lyase, iron-sulfur-dependent, subunit alpha [Anaerolineales bacterium]